MGKQFKAKKALKVDKGKVTPIQIAFIVDRYLCDSNFSETRSVFRTEASSLIAKSPIQEAPKSLLTLGAMLNEYICLKEQKVQMDQERVRLEQEKSRVQNLLQGMQSVMNAYNANGVSPTPTIPADPVTSMCVVPQSRPSGRSPPGCPTNNTSAVNPVATPPYTVNSKTLSLPVTTEPIPNKRKGSRNFSDSHSAAKKCCTSLPPRNFPNKDKSVSQADTAVNGQQTTHPSHLTRSSSQNCIANKSLIQGSSVAKCLFNQPSFSIPTNSSSPKTPPQANGSQNDKSNSPEDNSSVNCSIDNTPQDITPTRCTVISSKRVTISPLKQVGYYSVETNHCISSSSPIKLDLKQPGKRDHIKGRLDFDGSDVPMISNRVGNEISTSEPAKDVDAFDIDLPNLDAFAGDFSFIEMLGDFDLDCEGIGYSFHSTLAGSSDTISESCHETTDCNVEANQFMSEYSSTVTQILSEKDTNIQGKDSVTALKSITCTRILSPAKQLSSPNHESCS